MSWSCCGRSGVVGSTAVAGGPTGRWQARARSQRRARQTRQSSTARFAFAAARTETGRPAGDTPGCGPRGGQAIRQRGCSEWCQTSSHPGRQASRELHDRPARPTPATAKPVPVEFASKSADFGRPLSCPPATGHGGGHFRGPALFFRRRSEAAGPCAYGRVAAAVAVERGQRVCRPRLTANRNQDPAPSCQRLEDPPIVGLEARRASTRSPARLSTGRRPPAPRSGSRRRRSPPRPGPRSCRLAVRTLSAAAPACSGLSIGQQAEGLRGESLTLEGVDATLGRCHVLEDAHGEPTRFHLCHQHLVDGTVVQPRPATLVVIRWCVDCAVRPGQINPFCGTWRASLPAGYGHFARAGLVAGGRNDGPHRPGARARREAGLRARPPPATARPAPTRARHLQGSDAMRPRRGRPPRPGRPRAARRVTMGPMPGRTTAMAARTCPPISPSRAAGPGVLDLRAGRHFHFVRQRALELVRRRDHREVPAAEARPRSRLAASAVVGLS